MTVVKFPKPVGRGNIIGLLTDDDGTYATIIAADHTTHIIGSNAYSVQYTTDG